MLSAIGADFRELKVLRLRERVQPPGSDQRHGNPQLFKCYRWKHAHLSVTPNSQHQPRTRQATNLRMQIW